MFKLLKEKYKLFIQSPLKLFFFRLRQADKFDQRRGGTFWLACTVLLLFILVRLAFFSGPVGDNTISKELEKQAKRFINFAGNDFSFPDRKALERAEKIRVEKAAALQAKLEAMEKFSRVTFFYTAPYLGSVAVPEAWEKKYRSSEKNNFIDFYYAPTATEEYPLFQIGILSRDEWEKKQTEKNNYQALTMVSNFVFFYQIYSVEIKNPVKNDDYDGMQKQVKSILASFKSYKQ